MSYIFILIQEAKLDWLTATSSDEPLIGKLFGHELKLSVPILTEAADKRLFQELINREVFFLSFKNSHLAHIPTIVVERAVGTIFTYTNGVQVARYRFVERNATLAIGTLNGTVAAATLVVAGKHTVLAIDNRGYEFTTGVVVRDTLTLNDLTGFG